MADKKISELTSLTTPQDTDVIPIVDNSGTPETKKTAWTNIKSTLNTYFESLYEALTNKKTTLDDDSDTYYPSQKAVKTAVDAKAPKDITINTQETDAYTLVLTDDGKLVDIDYATAATLTVPKNAVVAFPIGTIIAVRQKGAGVVTIAPVDEDVTISYAEGLDTTGQHAMAALVKVAENTWVATGSLEA